MPGSTPAQLSQPRLSASSRVESCCTRVYDLHYTAVFFRPAGTSQKQLITIKKCSRLDTLHPGILVWHLGGHLDCPKQVVLGPFTDTTSSRGVF